MHTAQRVPRQQVTDRRSGGYSMIEMIVAITIAVVIGMGLYFIFTAQQRSSRSQKSYNDLQTNCAFAMDAIKSDLLLAGYRSRNVLEPISGAAATALTFEFWDDRASLDAPYDDVTQFTNHTQVTYSLSGSDLNKTIRRWHTPGAGAYDTPLTFTLAKNIQSLGFQYFKEDNVPWAPSESRSLIRTVRISLQCRAAQADAIHVDPSRPGGLPKYQVISLTGEVRPRNIAVAENPEDKTPPAPPLGAPGSVFKVWDEGTCGCLELKWTSNTDGDIAGYTVYYGLVEDVYIGRARAVHQAGETRLQLRNLTATNVPYYIALAAYDKSGNQSALSSTVAYANPTPSVRTESDPGNDTAITPGAPPAPGAPTVSTPADNQLQVSWTNTYSDCTTTPVYGFRVYRSTIADFTPDGASAGYGNCIADETTLGPTATSYLDTGADTAPGYLTGCVPYYYKIALVNCDPSQLTAYTDGDPATPSTYAATQFASVSGTPTDGSRTSPPVLTSTPGFRRISLDLENPSHTDYPDFMHTRVYFSTSGPPVLSETRDAEGFNVVNNGRLIPDRGGMVPEGGTAPTINFDDENNEVPPGGLGAPQLQPDQTYYFLAVAYDRCKNHSQDDASARSTAEQCNDCLEAQGCRNAPPLPTNLRVTQGCDGAPLRLEWDYDAGNYTSNPDFQGFRIVRCQGAGCVPADPVLNGTGTVLGGTYLSAPLSYLDDSVVDGELYNYRVYAGDCYYQRWLEGLLTADEITANDPGNNASSADIENIALGFFDRARVIGDLETTLSAGIDALATTIPVLSTTGWSRNRLQINTEVIECAGVTPTSFTDCLRGSDGTMAISHLTGTPVRSYPPAPARAAETGDLSLVPPTFLHNTVIVGARNTAAGSLTLNRLNGSWDDPASWFVSLLYNDTVTAFTDDLPPYDHGSSGSTVTLSPITVPALADNIPLKLTFRKADGTVDPTIDLRGDRFDLTWLYRNDATGITTCTREWRPPSTAGIVGPEGPSIMGTTQSTPTYGTVAWPVPGVANNQPDAIVSPADMWNGVTTFVHDTSGSGISSVRLYYTTSDPNDDTVPATSGAYPGCAPYTMVEMTNLPGTELWSASWPVWPAQPTELNDRNVWYYIVAVDNEGNFDREPEPGQGAFQYYQQRVDPCLSTPEAPRLTGVAGTSSVTLDWSDSWYGDPPIYHNANNYTVCSDLAGFRVYHQLAGGAWLEVPESPLPPTQQSYTKDFGTAVATLSAAVDAGASIVPVGSTTGFRGSGKIKIGDEVIAYSGLTANSFVGCVRGRDATLATGHAAGEAATQDLLALEANSFFVRAFDTCGSGAKYMDSVTFTEGSCNPRCDLQVYPSGWSISAGHPFRVELQACEKAGNGILDTIFVHVCSSVEGDDFQLTENAADNGLFSREMQTQAGTSAGGSNDTVMVGLDDTILVGGYASSANSWGDVNACSGKTYSCGGQRVVTVEGAPVDICAPDHTPGSPSAPTAALVAGDRCTGTGTSRMTLSWNQVAAPPGCTSLYYRGYVCQDADCTPNTALNGFFTSTVANCSGSTCTSNEINLSPAKISNRVFRFAVSAVCEINTCPFALNNTQTWESLKSAIVGDVCP